MKRTEVQKTSLPSGSRIVLTLPGADFADSYRFASIEPNGSALAQFLNLSSRTPAWMNGLMALRNQVAAWVGLRNMGALAAGDASKPVADYLPGQQVGIFTLQYADEREVIVEDRDKHLHIQVSLFRLGAAELQMSTVVHTHNRLGRAYMSVVGPVHGVIVPMMLRQISDVR